MATNARDESISALLDGELDDQEARKLLAQLNEEDGLARWSEYALIGEAMRDQAYQPSGAFTARFRAALADEPTVLAPTRPVARPPAATPFYWLAAAATVAAIAWTVVGSVPEGHPGMPQMQAANGMNANGLMNANGYSANPVGTVAYEVVAPERGGQRANEAQWVTMDAVPYLTAHQDYAHAVIAMPEMHYTPVSLAGSGR